MKLLRGFANALHSAVTKTVKVVKLVVRNVVNKIKDLWRNAETVIILTLASLGTSHFIGSYILLHPALAGLIAAEMIGPIAAIGVIWGLIRVAMWRRSRRAKKAQLKAYLAAAAG